MSSKNKRKRSDDEAPQPRKTLKASVKLTDLADELITTVLSYFDYFERSKLRRVCSRFLGIIDALPAPLNLELEIWQDVSEGQGQTFAPFRGRSWSAHRITYMDHPCIIIYLKEQGEGVMLWSPQNPPFLKTIRPSTLCVGSEGRAGRIDVLMLRRLAEDVGETVTHLTVFDLCATNAAEVKDALSLFRNRHGVSGLTKLDLSARFPLEHAISAVACLQNLVCLNLCLTEEMIPEWADDENLFSVGPHLSALASLPKLEELDITVDESESFSDDIKLNDEAVVGFMIGLSAITGLKRLSSAMFYAWDGDCSTAFATMLQGLSHLEELSGFRFVSSQAWQQLHSIGGHKKLRKLVLQLFDIEQNEIENFVLACNQDFPALVELEVHFRDMARIPIDEVVRAMEELKYHPSLAEVKCGWNDEDEKGDFFGECQQVLGERITLTEIDHVDA